MTLKSGNRSRAFVRICVCVFVFASLPIIRIGAQSPQQWKLPDIPWAFPVRDKVQPEIDARSGLIHVPGSTKAYTQDQIDDLANPPDWFPDEHAPMPKIVSHGGGGAVLGCASCHLGSGLGHPESANLAGVSAAYIMRQLADFKNGARFGEAMPDIAKGLSEDDARQASEWFAGLQPKVWQAVVETDHVPKTFVNQHLMRMPLPGAGDEPIGNRILSNCHRIPPERRAAIRTPDLLLTFPQAASPREKNWSPPAARAKRLLAPFVTDHRSAGWEKSP